MAGLAGGGFVVTWVSQDQDGSGDGVYARLFDDTGNALTGETQVSSRTYGDQTNQQVLATADGGFRIVYFSEQDANFQGAGIWVRTYDSTGGTVAGEAYLRPPIVSEVRPALTQRDDGALVALFNAPYAQGLTLHRRLLGQFFNETLAPLGGTTNVRELSQGTYFAKPAATTLTGGTIASVWSMWAVSMARATASSVRCSMALGTGSGTNSR